MKMAAFGGKTKFKGHDPIRYRRLQEQEKILQTPLTVQTPTMSNHQMYEQGMFLNDLADSKMPARIFPREPGQSLLS